VELCAINPAQKNNPLVTAPNRSEQG